MMLIVPVVNKGQEVGRVTYSPVLIIDLLSHIENQWTFLIKVALGKEMTALVNMFCCTVLFFMCIRMYSSGRFRL